MLPKRTTRPSHPLPAPPGTAPIVPEGPPLQPAGQRGPRPATAHEVEQAIRTLQAFYEAGRQSLEEYPGRMPYGKMKEQARKYRLHAEMLGKARVLAHPPAGYTPAQMAALYGLIRNHGFWHGRPVGPSHVIRFLTIHGQRQRAAFQRDAIVGKWSRKRLDAELAARFGRRREAFRKSPAPATPADALYEILRLSERWLRYCRMLRDTRRRKRDVTPVWPALSPAMRATLERVEGEVDALQATLVQTLSRARHGS